MAKAPAKKSVAKKKVAKKAAPKKKPASKKKKAVAFERTYKLVICRKLPATDVLQYWCWGNRWSVDKRDAHRFDRDFEAAQKMVEHVISHGKVIEDRGK